jgi:hypothetical protein
MKNDNSSAGIFPSGIGGKRLGGKKTVKSGFWH